MLDRNFNNLYIALDSLGANRLRSFLTALGIIFGVAAVIAMLAIGRGAQAEILDQMKLVGVNNIVIKPKAEDKKDGDQQQKESDDKSGSSNGKAAATKARFSKGLSIADAESIRRIIPTVAVISPEMIQEQDVIYASKSSKLKIVGVEPAFFEINNIRIGAGTVFNQRQRIAGEGVCIIGSDVKRKFFISEDPIGKTIKCGDQWLKIIGVTEEKAISKTTKDNLGIRDYNLDIYIPIQTSLIRYKNPSLYLGAGENAFFNNNDQQPGNKIFHQLDQLVIQVHESESLSESATIISRMLRRRHNDVLDFEITIPEQLLKQQQKTKDVFNIVLSAIAGISLLVGGIGIMNIMLASVLERTREIGIRMALGAQKKDIVMQFLFEAVLISLTGGIIGVILGVSGAYLVDKLADIHTIVSGISIFISFVLASAVGLIFGISPARKAAHKNPIECLRHD